MKPQADTTIRLMQERIDELQKSVQGKSDHIIALTNALNDATQDNKALREENREIKRIGYSAYLERQVERYKGLWKNARLRLADALEHIGISGDISHIQANDHIDRTKADNEYLNP
jgi:hypothetical protein